MKRSTLLTIAIAFFMLCTSSVANQNQRSVDRLFEMAQEKLNEAKSIGDHKWKGLYDSAFDKHQQAVKIQKSYSGVTLRNDPVLKLRKDLQKGLETQKKVYKILNQEEARLEKLSKKANEQFVRDSGGVMIFKLMQLPFIGHFIELVDELWDQKTSSNPKILRDEWKKTRDIKDLLADLRKRKEALKQVNRKLRERKFYLDDLFSKGMKTDEKFTLPRLAVQQENHGSCQLSWQVTGVRIYSRKVEEKTWDSMIFKTVTYKAIPESGKISIQGTATIGGLSEHNPGSFHFWPGYGTSPQGKGLEGPGRESTNFSFSHSTASIKGKKDSEYTMIQLISPANSSGQSHSLNISIYVNPPKD